MGKHDVYDVSRWNLWQDFHLLRKPTNLIISTKKLNGSGSGRLTSQMVDDDDEGKKASESE
jgi:hypothetical protein